MKIATFFFVGFIVACAVACTRTVYTPVEHTKYEDRDVVKTLTDTFRVSDTRFIYVKGDTVVDWRERLRDRIVEIHDTVHIERLESIPAPYPVEKSLSRWQRTKQDYGGYALTLVVLAVLTFTIWLAYKFRR